MLHNNKMKIISSNVWGIDNIHSLTNLYSNIQLISGLIDPSNEDTYIICLQEACGGKIKFF